MYIKVILTLDSFLLEIYNISKEMKVVPVLYNYIERAKTMHKNYVRCPHCNGTADRFMGEKDTFGRQQFGIVCDGCPACVLLTMQITKREPTEEDWERAEKYWNKRW